MTVHSADISANLEEIQRLHSDAEAGRKGLKSTVEAMIGDASTMMEELGVFGDRVVGSEIGTACSRLLNALMAFDRQLHVQDGKSERVEAGLRELIEKMRTVMQTGASADTATPVVIPVIATPQSVAKLVSVPTGAPQTAGEKPSEKLAPAPVASISQRPRITEKTISELMAISIIDMQMTRRWRSGEYRPKESFNRIPRSVVAEAGRIIRMIDMQDPVGRTLFMKMYNFSAEDIETCLAALRDVLPTPLPSESPTERQSRHDKAGRLGYELSDVSPDEAYESVLAIVPETVRFALEARKKFTVVNESAWVDLEVQKEAKRIFSALRHFPSKRQEFLRTYFFTERQLRRWNFQREYDVVKPETLRDVWAENEAAKAKSVVTAPETPAVPKADDPVPPLRGPETAPSIVSAPKVDDGQKLAALENVLGRTVDSFPPALAADLRTFDLQKLQGPRHRKETYQEYERAGRIMEELKNHRLLGRWFAHLGLPPTTPSLWNVTVEWSRANGSLIDDVEQKIAALQIPKAADREGRVDKSLRRPVAEIDILLDQFPHGAKADYYREIEVNVGTVSGWRKAVSAVS